jgi:hypothetical protein
MGSSHTSHPPPGDNSLINLIGPNLVRTMATNTSHCSSGDFPKQDYTALIPAATSSPLELSEPGKMGTPDKTGCTPKEINTSNCNSDQFLTRDRIALIPSTASSFLALSESGMTSTPKKLQMGNSIVKNLLEDLDLSDWDNHGPPKVNTIHNISSQHIVNAISSIGDETTTTPSIKNSTSHISQPALSSSDSPGNHTSNSLISSSIARDIMEEQSSPYTRDEERIEQYSSEAWSTKATPVTIDEYSLMGSSIARKQDSIDTYSSSKHQQDISHRSQASHSGTQSIVHNLNSTIADAQSHNNTLVVCEQGEPSNQVYINKPTNSSNKESTDHAECHTNTVP